MGRMQFPPLSRRHRLRVGPETASGATGGRLSGDQIVVLGEPCERPGPALGHHLPVEVAGVEAERAEHPAMLVAGVALHPHDAAGEFGHQCRPRLAALRLIEFRGVDSHEPHPHLPPFGVEAGDGVAVIDHLDPPGLPALGVGGRAEWSRGGDDRRQHRRGHCVRGTEPARHAPWRRRKHEPAGRRPHVIPLPPPALPRPSRR